MVHNLWLLTVGRLETSPVDFEVGLTFFIRFIGVKLIWVIKLNKYLRITLIIRANWVSQIAYGQLLELMVRVSIPFYASKCAQIITQ